MRYTLLIILMVCKIISHYPCELYNITYINQPDVSTVSDISIQQSADKTVSSTKDSGTEEQEDTKIQMQVARIGLIGVIVGAFISGVISVIVVLINFQQAKIERENRSTEAEKERSFIRSQSIEERSQTERRATKEKKTEAYLYYLQLINEVTYEQLEYKKQGKKEVEIKLAQKDIIEKMVLAIASVQMYGDDELYGSAKKLFKHIDNCRIDKDDYKNELKNFLSLVKKDIIP